MTAGQFRSFKYLSSQFLISDVMEWTLFSLGLIDAVAGSILFFNEGIVKYIGIIMLAKGIITIIKSLR